MGVTLLIIMSSRYKIMNNEQFMKNKGEFGEGADFRGSLNMCFVWLSRKMHQEKLTSATNINLFSVLEEYHIWRTLPYPYNYFTDHTFNLRSLEF